MSRLLSVGFRLWLGNAVRVYWLSVVQVGHHGLVDIGWKVLFRLLGDGRLILQIRLHGLM